MSKLHTLLLFAVCAPLLSRSQYIDKSQIAFLDGCTDNGGISPPDDTPLPDSFIAHVQQLLDTTVSADGMLLYP